MLLLIGYTSTCETAVHHSDWLYRLFLRCTTELTMTLQQLDSFDANLIL